MKVGILALQGAVEPHAEKLRDLGAEPVLVRRAHQLSGLQGIILPGGESSAMIHLLKLNELWEPLKDFVQTHPSWGVCAGCILLAKDVTHPVQESLAAIDISVTRNGYGRQNESFIDSLEKLPDWNGDAVEGVFIRAPRITRLGPSVKPLLSHSGETVMAQEGNVLVSAFHPELTPSTSVHRYFLKLCQSR